MNYIFTQKGDDQLRHLSDFRSMAQIINNQHLATGMGTTENAAARAQIDAMKSYQSRRGIFWKSLPLIASELGESLTLLTGMVFMAIEGEAHLAAIGMMHAFLLLCLVFGYAHNDAYQNYYARQAAFGNRNHIMAAILRWSVQYFVLRMGVVGLVASSIGCGLYFIYPNHVFLSFLMALPFLLFLVSVYAVGLAFHAFLAGNGALRLVGILALVGIAMNALFLYLLLYVLDFPLSPTQTVVTAGIFGEIGWVLSLMFFARKYGAFSRIKVHVPLKRIAVILGKASFFPGLSNAVFQVTVIAFFVYFSDCCEQAEVAMLSVLFSFWTVMMSPVNGICETAINGFSDFHARKLNGQSRILKKKLFEVALAVSSVVAVIMTLGGGFLPDGIYFDWPLLIILALLMMLAIRNRIGFAAIVVRLNIWRFLELKLLFIIAIIGSLVMLFLFFDPNTYVILFSILIGQVVLSRNIVY